MYSSTCTIQLHVYSVSSLYLINCIVVDATITRSTTLRNTLIGSVAQITIGGVA